MYKKLLIMFIFLFLLLPVVHAYASFGVTDMHTIYTNDLRFVGKQNTNFSVIEFCHNGGNYCSDTTVCNITVANEKSVLVNGELMVWNGTFFSYPLNATSDIGVYQASVVCEFVGGFAYDDFFIKITPSGYDVPESESLMYAVAIAFCLLFFLVSLVGAVLIEGKDKYVMGEVEINYGKYLKVFLGFISYLWLWVSVFFVSEIMNKFFDMANLGSFLFTIFKVMGYLIIPILPILFIILVVDIVADMKLLEEKKRNLPRR